MDTITNIKNIFVLTYENILKLIEDGQWNVKDGYGNTPLIWACEKNKLEVVYLLLKKGIDVNSKNIEGDTALHFACYHGNIEVIMTLLKKGSNVNEKNNDGEIPLHWFCEQDNPDVIKFLLEKRADVNAVDNYGRSPFIKACYECNLEIIEALLDYDTEIPHNLDEELRYSTKSKHRIAIIKEFLNMHSNRSSVKPAKQQS